VQDRPSVRELLEAVRAFLEEEAMPALDPRRRFHARVAANVLAIVERELDGEEAALALEWTRLAPLVGGQAAAPAGLGALRAAVREASAELAERIRRGDADDGPFAAAVRAHVRATVEEKLRVANPRYLGAGAGGGRRG
jgi:hypothetical protein